MKKTYSDGSRYDGESKFSGLRKIRHGKGTLTYPNGSKYEGVWKDDKQHGHGIFTTPDGEICEGEWRDGIENGNGTKIYPSGSKYVGEWKNGNEHGQGTMTFPDGSKYEGEWKDGKEHEGTLTNSDGIGFPVTQDYFDELNELTGSIENINQTLESFTEKLEEVISTTDESADEISSRHIHPTVSSEVWRHRVKRYVRPNVSKYYSGGKRYEGEYKDNKKHGQGVLIYPSGSKYVGKFKDDEFHGQGTFIWSDGRKYEGEWVNGRESGKFIITSPDGTKQIGKYIDGELQKESGQFTIISPDKTKQIGELKTVIKRDEGKKEQERSRRISRGVRREVWTRDCRLPN